LRDAAAAVIVFPDIPHPQTGVQVAHTSFFRRQAVEGWLFITPVLLGTLVFSFMPVIFSFVASLTDWDGINPPGFTGLANYLKLLNGDKYFTSSVWNTIRFTMGSIPFALGIGLLLAVLVNQKWMRSRTIYRTAFFAPSVTSSVAISLVFSLIYSPQNGLLNQLLQMFGIQGPDWLGTSRWQMPAVIILQVWLTAGYNMVIYLAGLQGISESLYESAVIDGATGWQQFAKITVPMLSPTTFFLIITSVISSFQIFNVFYVLFSVPAYSTTVYIYYLYLNAFNYFRMGYASAMAWVLFLVIGSITVLQWKMSHRWVHYQ
jgi:multiple sugar transport system permease protein